MSQSNMYTDEQAKESLKLVVEKTGSGCLSPYTFGDTNREHYLGLTDAYAQLAGHTFKWRSLADLGCGTGEFCNQHTVAFHGVKCCGVNVCPSQFVCDIPGVELLEHDVTNPFLSYSVNGFDWVNTAMCLGNLSDIDAWAKNCYNVTRPDGVATVFDLCADSVVNIGYCSELMYNIRPVQAIMDALCTAGFTSLSFDYARGASLSRSIKLTIGEEAAKNLFGRYQPFILVAKK